MSQTNHGSIEFLKFPDPQHPGDNTHLIKKWLRDSWARRKILALQQAIAAIVVPTASTANPQMDGTAAPGSSADYARADHVHPHDASKADAATTYTKSQVDALIPTNVSVFTNDAGYVTSARTEKTGADVITKSSAFANADITSVYGKVQGNICQIDAMIGSGTYSTGANTVGTLAAPFRPSGNTCYGIAFLGGGSATGTVARVAITTSGVLTIYAPSSVSTTARFSMVYAATL